jgi:hypothetical protein
MKILKKALDAFTFREVREQLERSKKVTSNLKAMKDFAADMPKPGPDGIIPRRK